MSLLFKICLLFSAHFQVVHRFLSVERIILEPFITLTVYVAFPILGNPYTVRRFPGSQTDDVTFPFSHFRYTLSYITYEIPFPWQHCKFTFILADTPTIRHPVSSSSLSTLTRCHKAFNFQKCDSILHIGFNSALVHWITMSNWVEKSNLILASKIWKDANLTGKELWEASLWRGDTWKQTSLLGHFNVQKCYRKMGERKHMENQEVVFRNS